jgi:undecaprenyl pyrophosphate synthase
MIHLGIIPDGNRRFLKQISNKNLINVWEEKFKILINEFIKEKDNKYVNLKKVNELSIYVCSIDNLNRDDNTKENVFNVLKSVLIFLKDIQNMRDTININFIGDINLLPKDLQKLMSESKSKLKGNLLKINLAIAYDYLKDIQNFRFIMNNNYKRKQSNIDLVFRSGGEKRLSGFFPTKTIYSELFFVDKLWPEINLNDIELVLEEFNKRNRRFGK